MIYQRSNLPAATGSPFSHYSASWGSPVRLAIPSVASVGASVALTTQQAYTFNPFPYFWLYDIVVTCLTTGNVAGEQSVDIYNTSAAGTSANSYFTTSIPLGQNVAAFSLFSALNPTAAQKTAATLYSYSTQYPFKMGYHVDQNKGQWNPQWAATYEITKGALFSLRAKTPASGAITDLRVEILGFVSDISFGEFR